jgi:hypothetical protein
MMTEEQIVARLLAGRLDKPPAPKPPPKPAVKAQERWAQKPPEAVAAQAAAGTKALAEQLRHDAEERRSRQYMRELAEYNAKRDAYQRQLDQWWQAKLDVEAEIRALHDEIPERGTYSPIARFERELKEGR